MAILARDLDAARRHLRALTIIEPDRPIHGQRLDALEDLMNEQLDPHGAATP